MKLILKALYNKKVFQYFILVLVLLLTVVSIQISITTTLKNETIVEKVNHIKAAHTNLYVQEGVELDNPISSDDIVEYLKTVNEVNNIDLIDQVEESYYNYVLPNSFSDIKNKMTQDEVSKIEPVYLEGYVSHKNSNQYKVLQGKNFTQLKDHEILINDACAKDRLKKHQPVIGGKYYTEQGAVYEIAGVYEDPAYYEDATQALNDSSILKTNLRKVRFRAMGKLETVKKNSSYPYSVMDNTGEKNDFLISQRVYKIHLKDYSIKNEATLLTLLQINTNGLAFTKIQPLYYQLQGDNTTQSIFKYLSYTLLVALIVGDFFVFYAFFKRKLDEDRNKLAMMVLCGIKQKNIIRAYLCELLALGLCTFLTVGVLDLFAYYILHLQDHAFTSIFFDMSMLLCGLTIIFSLLLFIALGIMIVLQIKSFFGKNQTRIMKEKDLVALKPNKHRIGYRWQIIQMALRDIFTHKFKFIRVTFASSFLLLSMMATYCTYQTMDNLYFENRILRPIIGDCNLLYNPRKALISCGFFINTPPFDCINCYIVLGAIKMLIREILRANKETIQSTYRAKSDSCDVWLSYLRSLP